MVDEDMVHEDMIHEDMDMKLMNKVYCNRANYEILSIEDPKKYPRPNTSVQPITPDGGSCIVSEPDEPDSLTIQDCDCNDPKNYDFYDKGRF